MGTIRTKRGKIADLGLGYDVCGVGGDSGIKGKEGRKLMELNKAMKDLPLPETLLSVIVFF